MSATLNEEEFNASEVGRQGRLIISNPISAGSYADNVRSETNATFNELAGEQREAENDNIVEFVTAYIGSLNAAKRKVFDKRVRRREGRPRRPANKRARPDITVAVDASGYSFT
ncbi:hypothetical protein ALC57_10790 [Trachymyrmex cornetzi]|uniref:Uncharacterized protein n=1 Tax=Trachymyrmex cornetzi TaxID=471704 RepID=A0A151J3B7_9HYME|nr:hypothetical protein ALC57_10790 [Trachymyrmex cornetzi]